MGKDTLVTIVVVADDQVTTNTYEVTFEFLLSGNATLQDINLNGSLMGGFNPETFEYTNMLPIGTTELPEITYEKGDEWQTVTVADNTTAAEGAYRIEVVAEDGTTNTYVLNFVVEKSHNTHLASVVVNDVLEVELFEDQDDYIIGLPYGTVSAVLTFEKAEDAQTVTLTQAATINDGATILVVAADGNTQRTLTFHFSVERSHEARLAMIYYNDVPVGEFDPDNGMYDLSLPFGTDSEPVITYDAMLDVLGNPVNYQSVGITALPSSYDDNGALQTCAFEMIVVAEDGEETFEYVLNFLVEKSPENRLRDLRVQGATVAGYDPETLYYLLQYKPYTDPASLPQTAADFAWTLYDSERSSAVLDIKTDEEGNPIGVYNIKVTAENGSVRTYTVQTEILLSDNTQLEAIYVNGKKLPNFNPEYREYIYIVPFGTVVLDTTSAGYLIDWELQEEGQLVERDGNMLEGLTYTIWVMAQDGSYDSYVIQFLPDDYDPTQVPTEDHVCVTSMPDGSWRFTTDTRNIMLYLADLSGHVMEIQPLDIVDPNCETICDPDANGYIYRDQPGRVIVYYFVYNMKKVVASGKFRTGY